jgi:hypothetical protein
MVAAMLLHEHTSRPVYRGSVKGHKPNVKHNREKGHYQLYCDYFHPTNPIFSAEKFLAPLPDVKEVVFDDFKWSEGAL